MDIFPCCSLARAGRWLRPLLLVVLLVACVAAWAGAFALRGGGDKAIIEGWADGMEAGQDMAQKADRPMIVLFTASWCGPCQLLKSDVLTQPAVKDMLQQDFVAVQVDFSDRSASNPNHAYLQRYGVSSFPTVIAMTPDGQPIRYYADERTPARFEHWLKQISPEAKHVAGLN